MKHSVLLLAVAMMVVMGGCDNQNKKDPKNDVKKAEKALFNEDMSTNYDAVPNAIETFVKYVEENPEAADAPEYLFKAFQVSVNTRQDAQQSIELCNRLLTNYPDYEKNAAALSLLASSVYDEQLHDLDQARVTYQQVIDNYPDSPFARDAALAIPQLGISLDDLIKTFEKLEQ